MNRISPNARGSVDTAPTVFFTVAGALLIAVLTYGLYLGLAVFSLRTDGTQISKKIAEGFATGVLTENDYPEDASHTHNQFNDCLILFQASSRNASTFQLAVSPETIHVGRDECRNLHVAVTKPDRQIPTIFYHNYIFGQATLARLLLTVLPLKRAEHLWKLAIVFGLFLGLAAGMIDLVKSADKSGATAFLIVLFVFMSWYGLGSFDQSVSHSPSDLVLIGFIVFLSVAHVTGGIEARAAIIACAFFGALTMIFELLTGGLPLGLCAVVGLVPLALREDTPGPLHRSVALASLSYFAAAMTCVLSKVILVSSFFDVKSVIAAGRELGARMALARPIADPRVPSLFALLKSIKNNMGAMYAGQREMALTLLLTALVAGAWAIYSVRARTNTRSRTIIHFLGGSNLVLIAWVGLFSEHTFVHAFFMDRIFAWPIASGLAMFALASFNSPARINSVRDAV